MVEREFNQMGEGIKDTCSCEIKCNICTNVWIAVFPQSIDKLECPHCNLMVDFEIIRDLIKEKQTNNKN